MSPKLQDTTPEPASFNLIRWFSLSALLVIMLISAVTSYLLSAFLEEHLLRRDAVVMQDFVERIARHHDPHGYFAYSYSPEGETLNDFFNDIAHMPDVARINAYATDGTIVWSSDVAMIGKKFAANHELSEALQGQLVYEKGRLNKAGKQEHETFSKQIDWFVENYIPIRGTHSSEIEGVVEIYRLPVALSHSISEGRRLVWLTISGGGMLLFLSLFWVVRQGHHLIRTQQNSLLTQARLATIGEMASSVAHSIRNPIASIRSSAELSLDGLENPEVSESLEDIIAEVDRFDGWIRELLTFTSEAGDPDATANICEVVAQSLKSFDAHAARRGVKVHNRLTDELPATHGEPTLLVQVLNSLIANSLDAMPHGGELVVDAVAGEHCVRLSVSDTGFGIPPDRLQGLFDPLVTHKNGGLGIGLALAKQIISRYSGRIDISSAPGSGTTVAIELPASREMS
ncbi:MAG: two-component sensor histidine kinase [Gammaproteobacteria bacterium]|nr:two-component sensor histidine kinase [Gammaproteobacteria bacterium]